MFFAFLALLIRIVSNPVANFYQKSASGFESSITVNLYSSLFMALFFLPFLFFVNWSLYNLEFYLLVCLSGLLCFLGTICLIKALSVGEMSVLGPLNSYKSVIGLLGAYFILGETPSIKALIGFLLIVCASFLFIENEGKFSINKSVFLRLLALLFSGMEAVILKKIILLSSPFISFILWCCIGFIFSFIFAAFTKKLKLHSKDTLKKCFITAVLLCLMQYSTNIVFKYFEVGLSLSLFQLSSVVSLFLGFKFLNEKGIIKKITGTVIMISGSSLILI